MKLIKMTWDAVVINALLADWFERPHKPGIIIPIHGMNILIDTN